MAWILEGMAGHLLDLEAIDKVPLLERRREIVAGMAKERMEKGRPKSGEPVVNLPQDTDKTRDSIAAEIGTSPASAWIDDRPSVN